MADLPRRAVTRTAKLASLPIGLAGRTAWGFGRRVGGRSAEQVSAELQARTAEQLFKVLGELKGGAMKFGQALSVFEAALPEEMAGPYRETLTKLQNAAPPISVSVVHNVLAEELGSSWRRRLTRFEDVPAAAASIGQVHRARWPDGRSVAVKIQYPGAGPALISDLNQLSRVARLAAGWVPGLDIGPILAELKHRMSEELDYQLEARSQEQFATAFDGDEVVAIPHVLTATDRVLVSEWQDGTPLSAIIRDGTPAERDHAGEQYLNFLLAGPQRAGILHADPHPGNYRILADGRLGVIDFGAVNRLPDGLPADMGRLLTVGLERDAGGLLDGLREEGFVRGNVDLDPQLLLDYLEPFIAPLRVDTFAFDREWLRGVFARINDPRRPQFSIGLKLNLPPSYLLIHRVWLGGIGVLCQLGAVVGARRIVDRWMPGSDMPPVGH